MESNIIVSYIYTPISILVGEHDNMNTDSSFQLIVYKAHW